MTLSWKLTESLELLRLDVGKSRKWSGFCVMVDVYSTYS